MTQSEKELAELLTKDERYNKNNLMTPFRLEFESKEMMKFRTGLVKDAVKNHLKGTMIKANPIKRNAKKYRSVSGKGKLG